MPVTTKQVVRDHVRNVGLGVVKDLQAKGGMDVSDDEGGKEDPLTGGTKRCSSDDVVTAMLEVARVRDVDEMSSTDAPCHVSCKMHNSQLACK